MAAQPLSRSRSTTGSEAPSAAVDHGPDAQRFEGASVEDVLAEVRATLGADAEILEANKLRSGGFGGFFAKETFEVVARRRVPGGRQTGRRTGRPTGRPTGRTDGRTTLPPGIDEAAFDRAAAHVSAARGGDPASGGADHPSRAAAGGGEDGAPVPAGDLGGARDLMDLAARVSDAEDEVAPSRPSSPHTGATATPPPAPGTPTIPRMTAGPAFEPLGLEAMPRLSTEGGAFSDVLHRIASDAGPEVADAVDRRLAGQGSSTADPASRPLTPVGPQVRARAQVAAERVAATTSATDAPGATSPPVTTGDATPSPARAEHATLEGRSAAPASDDRTTPAHGIVASSARTPLPAISDLVDVVEGTVEDRTTRLLAWLRRDDLPRTTIMTALRGLPSVPSLPDTTGVVVVVVGRRQEALKLCRRLAKAHDVDPADVVLASRSYKGTAIPADRRIIDITDATRDRRGWRRREQPTFVAVEAPAAISASALAWTREVVAGLEAHQVVGITSASCKTEDVAAWAERIGGVDVLALTGVDETTTPYAVLALEIPVGWLDDVPASPATWAQVLMEEAAA